MDRICEIVAEVLDLPVQRIDDGLTPDGAPAWDSLTHLRLVTAIEEHFGGQFSMADIQAITSVGGLRKTVARYV